MCDDEAPRYHDPHHGVSRRAFLAGSAGAVASVALGPLSAAASPSAFVNALPAATSAREARRALSSFDPNATAVGTAMHVHSSFDESGGSMIGQFVEAEAVGIDVMYHTSHDWRLAFCAYRTQCSFDSLDGDDQFGYPIVYHVVDPGGSARPSKASATWVSSPTSPADPSPVAGALRTTATATSSSAWQFTQFSLDDTRSRKNLRGNIANLQVAVDIALLSTSGDAMAALVLQLSYHPEVLAPIWLMYRVDPTLPPGSQPLRSVADGGTVTVRVPAGSLVPVAGSAFATLTVTPVADVAAAYAADPPKPLPVPNPPAFVAADNVVASVSLRAETRSSATVDVVWDNLRFDWSASSGASGTALLNQLISGYAPSFPSIVSIPSYEISWFDGLHFNPFPPDLTSLPPIASMLPVDPTSLHQGSMAEARAAALVAAKSGAVVSLNHLFGASGEPFLSPTARAQKVASTAQDLYTASGATSTRTPYGVTLLEVGYAQRGGCTLEDHVAVWDILSSAGIFLTGNGANDNHDAFGWQTMKNRFATVGWADVPASSSDPTAALIAALHQSFAAGRAFTGDVTAFSGGLDLALDLGSSTPALMGSVSVSSLSTRTLSLSATGLPFSAVLELWSGPVTPGVVTTAPVSAVYARFNPDSAGTVAATFTVPAADMYYRTMVNMAGTRVALSNPVYSLTPATAAKVRIPAARVPSAL